MKPRRTFESVVDELIVGLRSGDVVLDDRDTDATKLAVPPLAIEFAQCGAASGPLQEGQLIPLDHAYGLAQLVTVAEAIFGCYRSHERLWLIVGSDFLILQDLITSKVKDLRVLFILEAIPELKSFLERQQWNQPEWLKNSRVISKSLSPSLGFIAFTDSSIFWEDHLSKKWNEMLMKKGHKLSDRLFRVEKQSAPDCPAPRNMYHTEC